MALLLALGFTVPAHRRHVRAPAAEVAAPVATRLVAIGSRHHNQLLRPKLSAGDISRLYSTTYIYKYRSQQHCIRIYIYIHIYIYIYISGIRPRKIHSVGIELRALQCTEVVARHPRRTAIRIIVVVAAAALPFFVIGFSRMTYHERAAFLSGLLCSYRGYGGWDYGRKMIIGCVCVYYI